MHPTQFEILDSLRKDRQKRFSELLRDVAETSDNLTYHLRQLQKGDYVDSPKKGVYTLAQKGIVYLNNNLELSHDLFPTVSCMLELHGFDDTVLVMKKLKRPYLNKLHLPTFGVVSSASLQDQIHNFIANYQIVAADISFKCVHRDRAMGNDNFFMFDKFFIVFVGSFAAFAQKTNDRQFLRMTVTELIASPQTLSATKEVLALVDSGGFSEATHRGLNRNSE